ncbi:MAG: YceI family protein [Flavobacteriaceae bacterium]|nr:YceI family protein [Flavobacteriaceae bacterium]
MKKYLEGITLILMMIGISSIGYAQATYKIQDNNGVAMKLKGTSSLHDWEMNAHRAKEGEAQFIFNELNESELTSMKSLTFTLEVYALKGESKGLDNNAYKALRADKNKYISYKLTSATESAEKGGYLVKTKGKLTIAGVTNDIAMDIHLVVNKNKTVTLKGSYQLKMSDYKVEPPSFMMGMMTTGDIIKINFEVTYIKQNEG